MITRAYANTPLGQLHFAESGVGPVILCLHQAARSHDEYLELLPLLAQGGFRAIAMDMLGFGYSARLSKPEHLEDYARGALALLDALGVTRAIIMGHHTGGAVASEIAAANPERVLALIMSSTNFLDAAYRANHSTPGKAIEEVDVADDGSHILELWRFRQPYYPPARPDLLNRFIISALAVDPAEGHIACARYRMEERIRQVTAPTLIVAATEDIFTFPVRETLRAHLTSASSVHMVEIMGGELPLLETKPQQVAQVVVKWLTMTVAHNDHVNAS